MLFAYYMEDSEESKKLALEILIPLCFDVFAIQPEFLARSIVKAFYSFVMGFFLQ